MSDHTARPRRVGHAWIGVVLACLVLPALVAAQPAVPAEPAPETAVIDSVGFAGLNRVDPNLVTQTVQLKAGDTLVPYRLAESVRSLYALGLFDTVDTEVTPRGPGRVVLVFHLVERPPIRALRFTGEKFMNTDDLKEHASLAPGQISSAAALFRAREGIEKAYRDEGFASAKVTPEVQPDSSGQGVEVILHVEEGPRVKVRQVRFDGAVALRPKALGGAIALRPAGFLRKGRFSREKLDADVQTLTAYYRNHGYKDAAVVAGEPSFTADGRGVDLVFQVTEGPLYRFGTPRWEGATVYDPSVLRSVTLFRPGEAFDQSKIDNTIAEVNNLYTERGFLTGLRIEPRMETAGDSVRVVFEVSEGLPSHVGQVKIVGNTMTREHVIRRELSLYPGALLRRSQLLRSQRDAMATGYFEDVQVEFAPGHEEDQVDVTFRVKEKSSVTATAGAGYSSQAGLTGFVEFGHNNLFGKGQSVSAKVERGGKRDFYDLSFTEPWLSGRPISAGVDLYRTEENSAISSVDDTNQSFWERRWGGGVRVGFPWMLRFPSYTRLSFGYSITDTRYEDLTALPVETQDLLLSSQGTLSRVFGSLYRNSTDNPFHPTLGTKTTLTYEVNAGQLHQVRNAEERIHPSHVNTAFYRLTVDHRQYFVPFWKPVLMLRWRLGMMWPFVAGKPLVQGDLFRLGGTTGFDYLRGYHDYFVVPDENIKTSGSGTVRFPGGNVMLGLTGEVQFPIVDPVHGILFFDAGDTWRSGYDVTLRDLMFSVGAGVTLEIPMLGPIGFYYGYGMTTREWVSHFAFGLEQ